jgi:hypothetical protein
VNLRINKASRNGQLPKCPPPKIQPDL